MDATTHSSVVDVDGVDLARLDDGQRCARLADLAVLAAKVEHQMAVLVAAMSADGTFDRAGCRSETTYLTDRVHLSRGRANALRAAGGSDRTPSEPVGASTPGEIPHNRRSSRRRRAER